MVEGYWVVEGYWLDVFEEVGEDEVGEEEVGEEEVGEAEYNTTSPTHELEFTQHITNSMEDSTGVPTGVPTGDSTGVTVVGRDTVQDDIEDTYTEVPSWENVGMIVDFTFKLNGLLGGLVLGGLVGGGLVEERGEGDEERLIACLGG